MFIIFMECLAGKGPLTLKDVISFNPSNDPMPRVKSEEVHNKEEKIISEPSIKDDPVPKVKLSADGKLVIAKETLEIPQPSVFGDEDDLFDLTPRKRKKKKVKIEGGAWSHKETVLFYKALSKNGSDFELMRSFFPSRSRNNLRNKFKREEKTRGKLIDLILTQKDEENLNEVLEELEADNEFQDVINGKIKSPKSKTKSKHSLLMLKPWKKMKVL